MAIVGNRTILIICITVLSFLSPDIRAAQLDETIAKRLKMGEKPNRLIGEQSPYLLQHAFNPVDWYPWGDEAFAKAKAENKPIFLSIGYSTCHWCHVMAEESFENPEIAAILNKWFISIKVDREERPDIDQIYMTVTQAMSGSGGWPMSVFLFPDRSPFFAGTYFPSQSKYGSPGFADILTVLHDAWENKRADLENVAGTMIKELEKVSSVKSDGVIAKDIHEKAFTIFHDDFDEVDGGFGLAPKFPRPVVLDFLLQYWHDSKNEKALDIVLKTLESMRRGGVYDHLGGGFHRYATDKKWRVPHFEKMLYDQAQLANTYLDAYLITKDKKFAKTAEEIFEYVLRDMTDKDGGFYSAEDADSLDPYNPEKKSEGAFYLWTAKDINKHLEPFDAKIFSYSYGIGPDGNVPEDPTGEFKGKNILYLAGTEKEAASYLDSSLRAILDSTNSSRQVLLNVRDARERPHLDDKVITAWNGLMIGALARGGIILDKPEYLEASARAAQFIKSRMYTNNTLDRRYRNGESGLPGQLDDYAFLINGLLELYTISHDPKWLDWSIELTEKKIELFWNEERGGFFDSIKDTSLPVRIRGYYDGAEPSGNSIAAHNLYTLALITDNNKWKRMAAKTIDSFSSIVNEHPDALPKMLQIAAMTGKKPRQVIIAGRKEDVAVLEMLKAVQSVYSPGLIVLIADGEENQEALEKHQDFIKYVSMINNKATAYVCQDFTCKMPVNTTKALLEQLDK